MGGRDRVFILQFAICTLQFALYIHFHLLPTSASGWGMAIASARGMPGAIPRASACAEQAIARRAAAVGLVEHDRLPFKLRPRGGEPLDGPVGKPDAQDAFHRSVWTSTLPPLVPPRLRSRLDSKQKAESGRR